MFGTSEDVKYIRRCSVHQGDILSTLGDVQYIDVVNISRIHRMFQLKQTSTTNKVQIVHRFSKNNLTRLYLV